jgi:hypothetical protein
VNWQSATVKVAPDMLATAPPRPSVLLVVATAWLSVSTTRSRVRVLAVFRMPPPSPTT